MQNIFANNAFSEVRLTAAVNELPFVPGRIGSMGLFTEEGIDTTTVAIENIKGTLRLVQTTPRGGVGVMHTPDRRALRNLNTVHIQIDDHIQADQVQNVREFGSEQRLETVQAKVNQHFTEIFRNIDTTIEHLYLGAIKGQLLDADGSLIYNLFTEFGVAADADVDFVLGTSTTNIKSLCNTVVRGIANKLGAAPMGGVYALCGDTFYDKISTHAEVREAYLRAQEGIYVREGAAVYDRFQYGGIVFENYRGAVNGTPFIAADECRFFPIAVPGLFRNWYAPADYMSTVNTIGLPRYAKVIPDRDDKGAATQSQSNPLPICTIPAVLRRGYTSN